MKPNKFEQNSIYIDKVDITRLPTAVGYIQEAQNLGTTTKEKRTMYEAFLDNKPGPLSSDNAHA